MKFAAMTPKEIKGKVGKSVWWDRYQWWARVADMDTYTTETQWFETWQEAYSWALGRAREKLLCQCGLGNVQGCLTAPWGCKADELDARLSTPSAFEIKDDEHDTNGPHRTWYDGEWRDIY